MPNFFHCFWKALKKTIDHDGVEHAGYLAFLAMLGIFPFTVFFMALAGTFGQMEGGQQLIGWMLDHMPAHVVESLRPRISEIISGPPQGLITLSVLGTLWTASSTFESTRYALNKAYHVATPPAYILRRLLSVLQCAVFCLGLTVAVFLIVFGHVVWQKFEQVTGLYNILDPFWTLFRYAFAIGIILFLIATCYYVLPNIRQKWLWVLPGATVVTVLWVTAAEVFSRYIDSIQQVNVVYGSLGGLIVALVFFYVLAFIFILGAEFNYQLEQAAGRVIIQREPVPPEKTSRKEQAGA